MYTEEMAISSPQSPKHLALKPQDLELDLTCLKKL